MKQRLINYSAGLLVTALVLLTAAFTSQAAAPAPKKAQAKFEIKWMEGMIDHHAMAVMVGELCLERAVHPDLVAACEEMVLTQTAEIETLQSWLQEWYGVTHEPNMKPGEERMMERLTKLEGEEFEIAFMQMMVRHHFGAIRDSLLALRRAYHPELKELAQHMIEMQTAEIEQMQQWLCEWYDRCGGPRAKGLMMRKHGPKRG